MAGPSHIMPTGGTARFASPLHVRDFLKVTSVIDVGLHAHNRIAAAAARIAEAETLSAHASALHHRLQSHGRDAEATTAPPGVGAQEAEEP
jgi:histidinol dehydrogenase